MEAGWCWKYCITRVHNCRLSDRWKIVDVGSIALLVSRIIVDTDWWKLVDVGGIACIFSSRMAAFNWRVICLVGTDNQSVILLNVLHFWHCLCGSSMCMYRKCVCVCVCVWTLWIWKVKIFVCCLLWQQCERSEYQADSNSVGVSDKDDNENRMVLCSWWSFYISRAVCMSLQWPLCHWSSL